MFLIGIGGGVPHYTDYNKHVRLGDVVISHPTPLNKKYIYVYCESAKINETDDYHFETKEYCPPNLCLQEIAVNLKDQVSWEFFKVSTQAHMYVYSSISNTFSRRRKKILRGKRT